MGWGLSQASHLIFDDGFGRVATVLDHQSGGLLLQRTPRSPSLSPLVFMKSPYMLDPGPTLLRYSLVLATAAPDLFLEITALGTKG